MFSGTETSDTQGFEVTCANLARGDDCATGAFAAPAYLPDCSPAIWEMSVGTQVLNDW